MTFRIFFYIFIFMCVCIHSNCIQLPEIFSYYNENDYEIRDSECDTALKEFADSSSDFTYCTVNYSHPIHLCELCVNSYMKVEKAHTNILTVEVNGTKCKDKLINMDRLEVIESIFSNVQDLWKRAFCQKCFDWTDGKPTLSNQTKTFITYFDSAKKCINDHIKDPTIRNNTDKICEDCMTEYVTLNSFYESLKGSSETVGICMDIVDSMNATRAIWSDVLNCCRLRRTPELIFLCCTGVITALPAIFYLLAKIYCENSSKPRLVEQNRFAETLRCQPSTSLSNGY
ncbi:osteopetrosis-associated transmembrane protein 1 [Arctopsyche grandis]|uniref:osteopetrosis-associated transmembrane protein 1 n=1 Tax=Arctopsyche grandis TaxID=121162 RepID=UPI00406D81E5